MLLERPSAARAIQWLVWAILMVVVMRWMARSRNHPRPPAEERVLSHPRSTLIMGLVCFIFFAAAAILSNVFRNHTTTWWTTSIFVGFALVSLPMITDYFIARHKVDRRDWRTERSPELRDICAGPISSAFGTRRA